MKFESVTGKATVYVHQDFWAQVLVYNMVQDIRNSADEEAAAAGRENRNKYPMHTNENVAIGLFKETMLKILLEPEEKKRIKKTWRTTGRNGALCTSHKGTTWKRA